MLRERAGTVFVLCGILLAGCTPGSELGGTSSTTTPIDTTTSTTADPAVEHWVTIEDGNFFDRRTGERFVPRGVNYVTFAGVDRTVSPGTFDAAKVDEDFSWLARHEYNTVRVFIDTCSLGPDCITLPDVEGLNGELLDVIVELLEIAKRHGLVMVLTSNDMPDGGGYRVISARGDIPDVFPGYRNSDFLTASGHEAMAAYWNDLLAGLAERDAAFEVVLGWSIINEYWLFKEQPPLSLTSGEVTTASGTYDMAVPEQKRAMVTESTRAMIEDVSAVIRSHDPDGLVTMGFFVPQFPNPTEIGGSWYVDTAPLVDSSALDFFDFHAYAAEDIPLEQIAENFGVDDRRPVIMGETGAFVERFRTGTYAALAVQRNIALSCDLYFDGWLIWAYKPIPLSDRAWAFTDDDGSFGEALAPVNQPDPCAVTLTDPNLAAHATITASGELPGEEVELAVDGSRISQWGSGDIPPQWIELTWGAPVDIGSIDLTVAQWPEGFTEHTVTVTSADGTVQAHVFSGETRPGERLRWEPEPAIPGVVTVRIDTSVSPSWVSWHEIEILAPDLGS